MNCDIKLVNNKRISEVLYKISVCLEIKGSDEYKIKAYRRASRFIESYAKELEKVKDLTKLPSIGEGIAKKIRELIRTGKLEYYEKLKKSIPVNVEELDSIPGLGPKRIKALYDELKIKDKKSLLRAARSRKIRKIEGFGPIIERNIIENIRFKKKSEKRRYLIEGIKSSEEIIKKLKKSNFVRKVNVAGSVRRGKETIGDVDVLCTSNHAKKLMDYFIHLKNVRRVLAHGETKSSVLLHNNLQVDLRVIKPEEYGSALVHFTGSKDFNIALRKHFMKENIKINEYGIFKKNKRIAGETERDVFKSLKMQYIPPELRENKGEIELALKNKIPNLVKRSDIKGDLHVHSKWSDGLNSIKELADYARKELNYSYIGIADHLGNLRIANAINAEKIRKQSRIIKDLNSTYSNFQILHGGEANIRKDGSLDVPDSVLSKLDFVIASVHYGFKMSEESMTKRLLKALSNKHVNILGHPTGRKLLFKPGYEFDYDKVFRKAVERGIFLEIDSFPDRMDLNDKNSILAKSFGARFAVNTDAHRVSDLEFINLGVTIARRAGLTKKEVLNSKKLKKVIEIFT